MKKSTSQFSKLLQF